MIKLRNEEYSDWRPEGYWHMPISWNNFVNLKILVLYHVIFQSPNKYPRCVWPLLVFCWLSSALLFLHETLMEKRIKTKNISDILVLVIQCTEQQEE